MAKKIVLTEDEEKELLLIAKRKLDAMSDKEIIKKAKSERVSAIIGGLIFFFLGIIIGVPAIIAKNTFGGIFWIIVGLIFACSILSGIFREDKKIVLESIRTKLRVDFINDKKRQMEIGTLYFGDFSETNIENGFIISKSITIKTQDFFNGSVGMPLCKMLIDNENRKVIFQKGATYSKAIDYSNIIKYEIYENDKSVVQGRAGSALIGAVFFGIEGAIIGANRKRDVKKCVNTLKLILFINDFECTKIEINYIFREILVDSTIYVDMIKNLQEISGYIEYMINNTKRINLVD